MEQTKTFIEFWRGLDIHSREELRTVGAKMLFVATSTFNAYGCGARQIPLSKREALAKFIAEKYQINVTMQTIILIILACITGFLDFLILLYIAKSLLQARADDRQGLIPTLICFILNTIVAVALILKLW